MKKLDKRYEAPYVDVIAIESQGVLCVSVPAASTGAGGGTESMNMVNINWP